VRRALLAGIDANWPKPPPTGPARIASARTRTCEDGGDAGRAPVADELPERAQRDPRQVKARPDAIVVNEGANTLDFARSIVDMYEPRKRLDVGTWGIMGIGMGFAVAAAVSPASR
jgi:oxalyl-CoA decarboxylase